MDQEGLDGLLTQCKSNDNEVKIDAITKLQQAFESGIEINDPESFITALKACLRSSNNLLTSATLNVLPSFFPLVTTGSTELAPSSTADVGLTRQACNAFVGGLIDRLGDNRERVREKARECLVVLGGLASRCSPSLHMSTRGRDLGKGQETPLMIWERLVKESGLSSKGSKVREQSILTLVHLRRLNPVFPIKPYLPQLVEALEDTDGTVRDTARQSVVELFTGANVTDTARADLKKEMAKKNVRKTIVDSVLLKLMSGHAATGSVGAASAMTSPATSETGDAPRKEYVPPSLKLQAKRPTQSSMSTMSRTMSQSTSASHVGDNSSRPASRMAGELPATPTTETVADVPSVFIASVRDLENEFASMVACFEGKETEHNWGPRERAINRVRGMIKGDAHNRYHEAFFAGLKGGFIDMSFKTLASLRTTLATNTCMLYSELARALGPAMDPFFESVFAKLLGMAGSTKRIVVSQTQASADVVLEHTTPLPKQVVHIIWNGLQEKIPLARQHSAAHLKAYLEMHGGRAKHAIETSGALETIEKGLKKSLLDNNPSVRETARAAFWVFEGIWSERGATMIASLDGSARKLLESAAPGGPKATAPSTPAAKKSSVRAAIAATRAKAKAMATAPPTLRHAATSSMHRNGNGLPSPSTSTRPASPAASLKSSTVRRPVTRPLTPASPTRRIASFSPPSSSISVPSMAMHNRRSSDAAPLSASQSFSALAHRRNPSQFSNAPSSPGGSTGTLEKAAKTALPASPRRSLEHPEKPSMSPPSSPRLPTARVPSPTRIPSPTRRTVVRKSLSAALGPSLNNHEPFTLPKNLNGFDESLLLAQKIPLPDDSDSDDDSRMMMSFSAPYEKYNAVPVTTTSSVSMGSPPPSASAPIVEDALRARAEQAESAAERLLELVEPDDDLQLSPIPPSLLPSNGAATSSQRTPLATKTWSNNVVPVTPSNKKSTFIKQAALFQNSPAVKGPSSLVDVLKERKHETSWWLKRLSFINKGSSMKLDGPGKKSELQRCISALEDGNASVTTLKTLAWLSMENPAQEEAIDFRTGFSLPMSPSPSMTKFDSVPSLMTSMWEEDKNFERLFNALMKFLSIDKPENELEYGLVVLWEMLENQGSLLEGREADVFSFLLRIRFCNQVNVLEATTTIRDALVARVEPVYGLTTMHASLRSFLSDAAPSGASSSEIKSSSYAFGLIALGKFILRLPAEILEDELPRLKVTLTTSLTNTGSLVVRESSATCIIAAQLVLRDETHLFTLLDGLPDEKKNLLTYLFDKHGARANKDVDGTERLEKEMRRLDGRTSTPPRPK